MSNNAILFAVVAGVLTFIMDVREPLNPILITNILLGIIAGQLIDRK
nr:hypothetical protein [Lysinibacillus timonensis]